MYKIKIVFITISFGVLFSADVAMAQMRVEKAHRFETCYSYEYLDPHDAYGDWHKLDLALYTKVSPTFTYFVEGAMFSRREGEALTGTVGVYKDWTNYFYTYSSISMSSSSDYLHRFRADHDFNFKFGKNKKYMLTAGATYIYYSHDFYDFIISGGPTLYLNKWILHYRLFRNDSHPGSVESFSHLLSVGYGKEGWQWTYLEISFGKQAYLANALVAPEQINNNSLNVAAKHRYWLGKHYGIFGEVSYFKLEREYDKYGINLGIFYEF